MGNFMTTSAQSSCFPWWEQEISGGLRMWQVLNMPVDDEVREDWNENLENACRVRAELWLRRVTPQPGELPETEEEAWSSLESDIPNFFRWRDGPIKEPFGRQKGRGDLRFQVSNPNNDAIETEHVWDAAELRDDAIEALQCALTAISAEPESRGSVMHNLSGLISELRRVALLQVAIPKGEHRKITNAGAGPEAYASAGVVPYLHPSIGVKVDGMEALREAGRVSRDAWKAAIEKYGPSLGFTGSGRKSQRLSRSQKDHIISGVINDHSKSGLASCQGSGDYVVLRLYKPNSPYRSNARLSRNSHSLNKNTLPPDENHTTGPLVFLSTDDGPIVQVRCSTGRSGVTTWHLQEFSLLDSHIEPAMETIALSNGWEYRNDSGKANRFLSWVLPFSATPQQIAQAHRDLDRLLHSRGWR